MRLKFLFIFISALQIHTICTQTPCSQDSNGVYTSYDSEPEMLFESAILMKTMNAIAKILHKQIEKLEHKIHFTLIIDESGTTKLHMINFKSLEMTTEQKSEINMHLQSLKWKPATCNNLNVSSYVSFPLRIHVD